MSHEQESLERTSDGLADVFTAIEELPECTPDRARSKGYSTPGRHTMYYNSGVNDFSKSINGAFIE